MSIRLWAPYWYDLVHKSTGFNVTAPNPGSDDKTSALHSASDKEGAYPTLTRQELSVYRESLPFFNYLHKFAIGIDHLNPGK